MNEKEVIEQMEKDIRSSLRLHIQKTILYPYLARDLYACGYRKILEGSVVLSKEEYAEYVELRNSEVGELVKENRELGKQCLDWLKLYHKQLTQTDEARKETAKEILKKGEEFYKMSYHKRNAIHRLAEWIKDIFGVEVEE